MKISRPTLLLDEDRCRNNLRTMLLKARSLNLEFRPHFKTHQSNHIASWFFENGVRHITCSSIEMAEYFSEGGWESITVAFPFNILEIQNANRLAAKLQLNLLVESGQVIDYLLKEIKYPVEIWIKIDVGTNRTGINPVDLDQLISLHQKISDSDVLNFAGVLAHAGHSYDCRSHSEILEVHNSSLEIMNSVKILLGSDCKVSVGDTPTCSVAESFNNVNEIRPGNFIFYDLMQTQISSCLIDQVAVAMLCPIVAKHNDRNEAIIHGGAIHFGKDYITDQNNDKCFGVLVDGPGLLWQTDQTFGTLIKLSQEHGTLKIPKEHWDKFEIGDLVKILPVHSCMTVHSMRKFLNIKSNQMLTTLNC